MSTTHPALTGLTWKTFWQSSAANTLNQKVITVPAGNYAALYYVGVSISVAVEGELEALIQFAVSASIGSTTVMSHNITPFLAHDDASNFFRYVDLGPWQFAYPHPLYTGVQGDNLDVSVGAAGAGVTTAMTMIYAGD